MKCIIALPFFLLSLSACQSRQFADTMLQAEEQKETGTIFFGEDISQMPKLQGHIHLDEKFKISYNPKRFLSLGMKCDSYNGLPLCPTPKAYARFVDGEKKEIATQSVSGAKLFFVVPKRATAVEVWVEGITYSGVEQKIDDNDGENYTFNVE